MNGFRSDASNVMQNHQGSALSKFYLLKKDLAFAECEKMSMQESKGMRNGKIFDTERIR